MDNGREDGSYNYHQELISHTPQAIRRSRRKLHSDCKHSARLFFKHMSLQQKRGCEHLLDVP